MNLWGGGQGVITMTPVKFECMKQPTRKEIAKAINDGRFGCESIDSAKVFLSQYFDDHREYIKTLTFKSHEIPNSCKRGI